MILLYKYGNSEGRAGFIAKGAERDGGAGFIAKGGGERGRVEER